MQDYVCIKKYAIKLEAQLAKTRLIAYGIESHIPDPKKNDMFSYSFEAQNPFEISLLVHKKDLEKAKQILKI